MKHNLLILLGTVLLVLAAALFVSNEARDLHAGHSSRQIAAKLRTQLLSRTEQTAEEPDEWLGLLSIPRLDLELPVRTDWSEELLKTSPCRFSGSAEDHDLVIMAHNYRSHFGPIRRLRCGDEVVFTDGTGSVTRYHVAACVTIAPEEPEAVTESGYDLTLFTCTYCASTRTAVFCTAVP